VNDGYLSSCSVRYELWQPSSVPIVYIHDSYMACLLVHLPAPAWPVQQHAMLQHTLYWAPPCMQLAAMLDITPRANDSTFKCVCANPCGAGACRTTIALGAAAGALGSGHVPQACSVGKLTSIKFPAL
jgi:hypothetical protein